MNIDLYNGPDADNLAFMCGQLVGVMHRKMEPDVPVTNRILAGLQLMLLRLREQGYTDEQIMLIAATLVTGPPPPFADHLPRNL
jgi:hypothetical protein